MYPLAAASVRAGNMSSEIQLFTESIPSSDLTCASSFLVYDWFQSQFPAWKASFDPMQVANSQSITAATIPESPNGPKGMVHFKSILDPLWTAADLASLRSGFPWVLLVLSPFERFYELDPALDQLSVDAPQLAIWRPDRPTVEESAHLRVSSLVSASRQSDAGSGLVSPGYLDKGIRQLLTALYVRRGLLIVKGARHTIQQDMGNLSLPRYLAACLVCLASSITIESEAPQQEAEGLALRWSSLLCRTDCAGDLDLCTAKTQTLAWAARHLDSGIGILLGRLHAIPDAFLTTRFRNEAKSFETALERIQHIFRCLRGGEIGFAQAMAQVAQTFSGDEAHLLRWRNLAEDLPGFLDWLPVFENAFSYLRASFRTTDTGLEDLRKGLLAMCDAPHQFLDAVERLHYERDFGKFKAGYIEYYQSAHAETVNLVANQDRMKARVDSVALRNLELLSDLDAADRGHLNHVRAIGKFLQANQCGLPVRAILERQPYCHCRFNPAGNRLLVTSVDEMNKAIQEGIDSIRSLLRKFKLAIIRELEDSVCDDHQTKQIAALLSRGPMVPLTQPCIDFLNSTLRKNPGGLSEDGLPSGSDRPLRPGEMSDLYAGTE